MSFITKRDRVFHEYELFDLPSRNEGKLKAYASCTDARAWSHFCSDKTEHLVDVIKRNNEICRPKYVPTDVIVNTLMRSKNKEIARLRRRIAEVEELLCVYDQLELNNEQKQEIEHAHASIKEANKGLEDMFLDLNASGYTEGIDSDAFQTGKSRDDDVTDEIDATSLQRRRGDETGDSILNEASICSWPEPCPLKTECKCTQIGEFVRNDAETTARIEDPRIKELKEEMIEKDARLNALANMTAVLENDVFEPYCVYAHIHTALEKIFAVLRNNAKYKKYLDAMMAGRDILNFDILGKIVFKMKVLEKFNNALISPCTQDNINYGIDDCRCTQIVSRAETTGTNIALVASNSNKASLDSKRAKLVADIMDNAEMREILSKEIEGTKLTSVQSVEDNVPDIFSCETYNINLINVKRIKDLQLSYDELMNCYDELKHEKLNLEIQLSQHEQLEQELNDMKKEFREQSQLLKEKDFYKKKSYQLNELEERCLALSEEATSLEVQLKAESKINIVKNNKIEDLRSANYELEKTLSDASLAFEKEKNALQCKIKELECKIMCQEQEIKSLSGQIDHLLEQKESEVDTASHEDEINSLNEQIKNLKEVILCKEEEKDNLHDKYQEYIAKLRAELEAWKNNYEKLAARNEYLELTTSDLDKKLKEVTTTKDSEKEAAVENLIDVITNKTEKLNELEEALQKKTLENKELLEKLRNVKGSFSSHLLSLENEKREVTTSLLMAKQESKELLEKVKNYDELIQKHEDMSKSFETNSAVMSEEIAILRDLNNDILKEKHKSQNELDNFRRSLEISQNQCRMLESKVAKLDDIAKQFKSLKASHEKLLEDKTNLERELNEKTRELERMRQFVKLERKKSGELVNKLMESESSLDDAKKLHEAYLRISEEKQYLQDKSKDHDELLQKVKDDLSKKSDQVSSLIDELEKLKTAYDNLLLEKNSLQSDNEEKKEQINDLQGNLEKKNEENQNLYQQVQELQINEMRAKNASISLEHEKNALNNELHALKKESKILDDKIKHFAKIEDDYNQLKQAHVSIQTENNELLKNLRRLQAENDDLSKDSQHIMQHAEEMENALLLSRNEALSSTLPENLIPNIKNEVEKLKNEKNQAQKKINDLLDQLEESDNIITNQAEALLAQEDRIHILERQIAQLKDGIKTFHDDFDSLISLGEQIKDNSLEHINQSLKTMQAHQSTATHNMKLEIAKLQNEKAKLEAKLSDEEINTERKFYADLKKLQHERDMIVTDIKQLEVQCVGDSPLSAEFCDVDNVLESLERIRQYIEANKRKKNSLEETLSKLQNSSQILVSKAGEAQNIAEKEQQRINKEKEEAIREKQNLEQQLLSLKDKLESQVIEDKNIIKELEKTAHNQKLIINKISDDIKSLQNLYEDCLATIKDLRLNNKSLTDENQSNMAALEATKQDLKNKADQLQTLQTELHLLKNIPVKDSGDQVIRNEFQINSDSQTDKIDLMTNPHDRSDLNNFVKSHKRRKSHKYMPNEVQILRADVDSSQDFVKNAQKQTRAATEYELDKDGSQGSLNYSLETSKDTESVFKSSTSHAIDLDIDMNSKQVAYASDIIKNKREINSKNMNKPVDLEETGAIFTIYDNSPESSRQRKSRSLPRSKRDEIIRIHDIDDDDSIKVLPIEGEIKSINSISSTYVSPVRTIQSVTNIHSVMKSSISQESESLPNISNKSSISKMSASLPNISNNSSENDYYQEKIVFNVTTDGSDIPILKPQQKKTDLRSHKLSRVGGNDKLFSKKNKTDIKALRSSNIKPDIPVGAKKYPRSHSAELNNHSKHRSNEYESLEKRSPFKKHESQEKKTQLTKHSVNQHESQGKRAPFAKHGTNQYDSLEKPFQLAKRDSNLYKSPRKGSPDAKHETNQYESQEKYPQIARHGTNQYESPFAKHRANQYESQEKSSSSPTRSPTRSPSKIPSKMNSNSLLSKSFVDRSIMVKLDDNDEQYKTQILRLNKALANMEKDYKHKIEVIKSHYDNNIKSVWNEHNQGVSSLQRLHEETLQDIINTHENEAENLRTLSIDAMKKAEKLEKENNLLKSKQESISVDESSLKTKGLKGELKKKRINENRQLTKTDLEKVNITPKGKGFRPCTCSLDINVSDTIRNIFEQADSDKRRVDENTYLKYIVNKMIHSNIDSLETQELAFLHLKVCRTWKFKIGREEVKKKPNNLLENELVKTRNAQKHIAELDRLVAEERRRLNEVREAVYRSDPVHRSGPVVHAHAAILGPTGMQLPVNERNACCSCNMGHNELSERRSMGDLILKHSLRPKRARQETNRAIHAKLDTEERRERRCCNDEQPVRLRRSPAPPAHAAHPAHPQPAQSSPFTPKHRK